MKRRYGIALLLLLFLLTCSALFFQMRSTLRIAGELNKKTKSALLQARKSELRNLGHLLSIDSSLSNSYLLARESGHYEKLISRLKITKAHSGLDIIDILGPSGHGIGSKIFLEPSKIKEIDGSQDAFLTLQNENHPYLFTLSPLRFGRDTVGHVLTGYDLSAMPVDPEPSLSGIILLGLLSLLIFGTLALLLFKKRSGHEFAERLAHDIRSPLLALNVALDDVSNFPEKKRVLVRQAIARIQDIANSVLETNRAEEVRVQERPSLQLLSPLVDNLVSEKRAQYPKRNIFLKLDPSSYGASARILAPDLKRTLSNLMNNSIEATSSLGVTDIILRQESDAGTVQIEVRDNGKGIPAELLPKLTQKRITLGKREGSGLGLFHANQTVTSWGGSLTIHSKPGRGTSVVIELPASPPPSWFLEKLQVDPMSPIVVLDDDMTIHEVWKKRFEKMDLRITHLFTIEELTTFPNGLYLVDYELRGKKNGLEITEALGITKNTILVTARFEDASVLQECRRLGVRILPKNLAGLVPIEVGTFRIMPSLNAENINPQHSSRS